VFVKRPSMTVLVVVLLVSVVVLIPGLYAGEPALALDWSRAAAGGFGDADNAGVQSLAFFSGRLYAGAYNRGGCRVWSCDGTAWTPEVGQGEAGTPTGPGFGDPGTESVSSLVVYNSRLYAGTRRSAGGCRVWSYDGTAWTPEVGQGEAGTPTGPGFGDVQNNDVPSLAVYRGRLYAGTYNAGGCQVWSYDGTAWTRAGEGGFGDPDNFSAVSMAVYVSSLYVGTFNNDYTSGCQVWSYDGTTWTQEVGKEAAGTPTGPGFGDSNNRTVSSMAVYNAGLYVGTYDSSGGGGCQVWSYDGANWTRVAGGGFSDKHNLTASSMVANGLDLYVGTYNENSGCEVWRYDGGDWYRENTGGFGYKRNSTVNCMAMEGAWLYAGTEDAGSTPTGCEVWKTRVSEVLYFAEGYTGASFHEYLCLGNPQAVDARAAITYLFRDGTALTRVVKVPAESRFTVYVNADVGEGKEVSVKLESSSPVVAERPMYFTYNRTWSGGHDAMGVSSTSNTWYFAEGYTGQGFDEWICVLNPGATDAMLTFRFQTEEEGEVVRTGYNVPACSRGSFKVNDILGGGYQNSLKLESSSPVVAERPMYFDYLGTGNRHWQGGHCVMGVPGLGQVYYFAEGTTRAGFEEWLTLQNPNRMAITVGATYQPGAGQGDPVNKAYPVAAGERYTVYVPGEVGEDKDVSVTLASTAFFLAERPMYFLYTGYGASWPGGDCVIGSKCADTEWFLAEGYTGPGFHTWLCLQNPGIDEANVSITYYTQEKGPLPARTVEVPAGTRKTVFVNDHAGPDYQLSFRLTSNCPIVVERPMYFNYGVNQQGGHDVVGYPE